MPPCETEEEDGDEVENGYADFENLDVEVSENSVSSPPPTLMSYMSSSERDHHNAVRESVICSVVSSFQFVYSFF